MENNTTDKDNKDLAELLDDLKVDLTDYTNKRFRWMKLDAFEKLGIASSVLGYGILVILPVSAILFFSLFGLAFLIGELLGSLAAGFGILALFSFLVLLIIVLNGKKLRDFILDKTITFLQKVDKNDAE